MLPQEVMAEIAEMINKIRRIMKDKKSGYVAMYLYIVLFATFVLYVAGSVTSASFSITEWSFNVRAIISGSWVFALFVSAGFVSELVKLKN